MCPIAGCSGQPFDNFRCSVSGNTGTLAHLVRCEMRIDSGKLGKRIGKLRKRDFIRFRNRYGTVTVPYHAIKTLLASVQTLNVSIRKRGLVCVAEKATVTLYGVNEKSSWTINIGG